MEPTVDLTLRFILDELQKMETHVGDRIEGRCSGIECRVGESKQRSEECFISLKMVRTESEQGHTGHWRSSFMDCGWR
jgi:hypothetical protein